MVNQLLVTLVNSVLGSGKPTARNNYAYHCPFCNHHKPKLEIQLVDNKEGKHRWACWACLRKGTTIHSLFKQLKAPVEKLNEARRLIKSSNVSIKDYVEENAVELPKEFKPLSKPQTCIESKHALHYLTNRGITQSDIIKYNIGFCSSGPYKNMIIIPTYDSEGKLNFFTGRSFEKEPYIKYKNPSVSRNVIPNEHLINWNLPLIICEGLFDALAIKRNAIPLLGKNIQSNLMKKLVTSTINKVYIALDRDAMKQALSHCETLLAEDKEVYLVDLQDKDPSEMGFENFTKLIQNTSPITYFDLMEKKLELC